MKNDVVIEVKDVTKSFKIYTDKGKMLKEKFFFVIETDMKCETF